MLNVVPAPSVLSMETVPPNARPLDRTGWPDRDGRRNAARRRVEPDAVVLDPQHEHPVLGAQVDPRPAGAGVARRVAERLAGHLQELHAERGRDAGGQVGIDRQVELDLGGAGRAELVGQRGESGQQIGAVRAAPSAGPG